MTEDWAKMREQWMKGVMTKGQQKMPEKACGKCKNFRQNSVSAAGDGHCMVLKDGDNYKMVVDNTDAADCQSYAEIDRMRTDTGEFMWDTEFRPQRQLDEK